MKEKVRVYGNALIKAQVKIKSANSSKLIFALCDVLEKNTGAILLPSGIRKKICESLEINASNFSKYMKELENVDVIRKVANGVYFMNPLFIWKGSTEAREAAIPEYLKINAILTDCVETIHSQL